MRNKPQMIVVVVFSVAVVVLLLIAAYNFGSQDGIRAARLDAAQLWLGEQKMDYVQIETENYGYFTIGAVAPSSIDHVSLARLVYEFNKDRGVNLPQKITDNFLKGSYAWIPKSALK